MIRDIAIQLSGGLVTIALTLCACRESVPPSPTSESSALPDDPVVSEPEGEALLRLINIARAHYENKESAACIDALTKVVASRPESPELRVHLALAYLLARQHDRAMSALREAQRLAPDSVAVQYLIGVTYLREGRGANAIDALERATNGDPTTTALQYQLGTAYLSAQRFDAARERFREVVRLDPRHASAYHHLMLLAQRAGDSDEARRNLEQFLALREVIPDEQRTPDALERCRYTKMSGWRVAPEVLPAIPIRFTDVSAEWGLAPQPNAVIERDGQSVSSRGAAAILDIDKDGTPELLVTDRVGVVRAFERRSPIAFDERNDLWGVDAEILRPTTILVGDYDNNGIDDVFLLSPEQSSLLAGEQAGRLINVTADSGLSEVKGGRCEWIDYDHDGDLDLLVVGAPGDVGLWQNRGDGTFQPAPEFGFGGALSTSQHAAVGDYEADDDLDMYLATTQGVRLLRNEGEGRFISLSAVAVEDSGYDALRLCALDDLDHDAELDLVTMTAAGGWVITAAGRRHRLSPGVSEPSDIVLLDFDNDGWTDVLALGVANSESAAPLRIWRNHGGAMWHDVTAEVELPRGPLAARRAAIGDLDEDGDSDILLATDSGPRVLRNDGGNARRHLKVRLTGLKTNRSGLGATVEVRAGRFRATRNVIRWPIELGVADHTQLDSVRVVWTNGIVQHDVDVAVDPVQPLMITERNVAAGSCPFLYAWSGRGFRFVTDILGVSPVGLSAKRGAYLPADSDELVKIGPADAFPPRDGKYALMITDEMREILYLDQAQLVAVDRDIDQEVHATDKLMMPPFPQSQIWWLSDLRNAIAARDEGGQDCTKVLRQIDGTRVGPTRHRVDQLRGLVHPTFLTLDFQSVGPLRRPVLALTGWLQYGDASVNVAAGQQSQRLGLLPRLEQRNVDGSWRELPVSVGVPAGKTKTILCDLSDALAGFHGKLVLRLSTDLEVYWDRIVLAERMPGGGSVEWLQPNRAKVAFRGFSARSKPAVDAPEIPDPAHVSPRPPWRRVLSGACTRYGDVTELLMAKDNRIVILNSGDAIEIEFGADLPAVPEGKVREFFLYSVGWDKDGDYNVAHNQCVDPLPFHGMDDNQYGRQPYPWTPELREWAAEYNTRWVDPHALTHDSSRP